MRLPINNNHAGETIEHTLVMGSAGIFHECMCAHPVHSTRELNEHGGQILASYTI